MGFNFWFQLFLKLFLVQIKEVALVRQTKATYPYAPTSKWLKMRGL